MTRDLRIRLMDRYNFTPTQKRIAELLMKGYSNKEIADKLHVTEKAVKCQLTRLYKSTKTLSRPQLMNFLGERGWYSNIGKVEAQNVGLPVGIQ